MIKHTRDEFRHRAIINLGVADRGIPTNGDDGGAGQLRVLFASGCGVGHKRMMATTIPAKKRRAAPHTRRFSRVERVETVTGALSVAVIPVNGSRVYTKGLGEKHFYCRRVRLPVKGAGVGVIDRRAHALLR